MKRSILIILLMAFVVRCNNADLKNISSTNTPTETPLPIDPNTQGFGVQIGNVTSALFSLDLSTHDAASENIYGQAVGYHKNFGYYQALQSTLIVTPPATTNVDTMIVKYDFYAQPVWMRQLVTGQNSVQDSSGTDAAATGTILVDSQGNAYVGGHSNSNFIETSAGGYDLILTKIDKDGTVKWIRQFGSTTLAEFQTRTGVTVSGAGNETFSKMAFLSNGNILIVGTTTGNFGETNGGGGLTDIILCEVQATDGKILKIHQLGTTKVASYIAGGGYASSSAAGTDSDPWITISSSGKIYIAFTTTSALAAANAAQDDMVISEWDSSLNIVKMRQIGNGAVRVQAKSIAVDSTGIYVGARTNGNFLETANVAWDPLVYKLNADFTSQFEVQFGTTTLPADNGSDWPQHIQPDGSGGAVVIGVSQADLSETHQGTDVFFIHVNSSGVPTWVKNYGQTYLPSASSDEWLYGCYAMSTEFVACSGGTKSNMFEAHPHATMFELPFILKAKISDGRYD